MGDAVPRRIRTGLFIHESDRFSQHWGYTPKWQGFEKKTGPAFDFLVVPATLKV